MMARDGSRPDGFLNTKAVPVLCCGLLAALLLAHLAFWSARDKPLDTRGWKLSDFVAHLERRGLQLHAVPTLKDGPLLGSAYLTEDPGATWESMQSKVRAVERIDLWRGTVWVGHGYFSAEDEEDTLVGWGGNGCRIGDFLLFGDERLLRRIQAACR
jgi:hypothetical protein